MITLKAYAKINLTLDLVGKRADGYHLLRSVMQKVSLCDFVSLEKAESGITLTCNKPYIPTDEKNIVYKVAKVFFDKTGIVGGVHIHLKKHVPCGAGLGGGSSDGAVALDGLCSLFEVSMSADDKAKLCENIGADIPFFFYSGTSLIEGIGEKVTQLPFLPDCRIVIVKPQKSISTPVIFKHPATAEHFGTNNTDKVIEAIEKKDLAMLCDNIGNALEPASEDVCSEIKEVVQALIQNGASAAMMSGSGSAVFGIFPDHKSAKNAKLILEKQYRDTYITKPIK